LAEFTGERVIPGQVDIDLLNEHMARYAFAARLARGKRALDAGCGAGYGSAELAKSAASVVGLDVAPEAVAFARANYASPNLRFEQASCAALPHPAGAFDLVVAFEVIEHIENWREFLQEVRRVLAPTGQFIVSTPNLLYYTESRGPDGANPFHVHEFTFEEFRDELRSVFAQVALFLENHVEGFSFQPHEPGNTVELRVDAGEPAPDESHFFVAVCAHKTQIGNPTFVYVPRTANVLRERERHIALLEAEIAAKTQWLEKAQQDLAEFDREHKKLLEELAKSNQWAEDLDREVQERRERVRELQEELKAVNQGYAAKVANLEAENREKTQWALDTEARLSAEVEKQTADLVRAVDALHSVEKQLEERSAWGARLQEEAQKLEAMLAMCRESRWVKLGRKLGLGPAL
jgi:SAM-dependent methyltransferase